MFLRGGSGGGRQQERPGAIRGGKEWRPQATIAPLVPAVPALPSLCLLALPFPSGELGEAARGQ